jgi:hypothetical protein
MYLNRYFLVILTLISLGACKKGFEGTKKAVPEPETFMVVDTIFRTGENRLTTSVDAYWWGNSAGGFIAGYEVSTDNMLSWQFTKSQDSTFLLKIPPGKDSADIVIYIRAIDNLGQKDPTPASTLYPIKNSKPEVRFVFSQPIGGIASQNPTIVFPVLKYTIFGSDPDGNEDIKGYELYLNDTNSTPYSLPANTSSFLLQSNSPAADSSNCKVFVNGSNNALSQTISGLKHNSLNTIYIRVIDNALSKSGYVATPAIWVKKVSSNILVLNGYSSNKFFVQNFYTANLKANGITKFDTLQATEIVNDNYTQLQPDFQTQAKTFALFKKMLWFGDNASFMLSFGQRSTTDFFNNGGVFFMAVAINSSFDPLSNFLDWTPVKSLINPPAGSIFRVNINAIVNPVNNTWPSIKSTAIIASARPFELPFNTPTIAFDSLYFNGIIESKPGQPPIDWKGQSTVIAKRFSVSNQKTNFIISSIPLERFNGLSNCDTLFNKIFIGELGF